MGPLLETSTKYQIIMDQTIMDQTTKILLGAWDLLISDGKITTQYKSDWINALSSRQRLELLKHRPAAIVFMPSSTDIEQKTVLDAIVNDPQLHWIFGVIRNPTARSRLIILNLRPGIIHSFKNATDHDWFIAVSKNPLIVGSSSPLKWIALSFILSPKPNERRRITAIAQKHAIDIWGPYWRHILGINNV